MTSHNEQTGHGSTSRSLLVAAQNDDPEAWERLVKLYAPLVANWCRRSGIPEQDVGDVIQEVFAAVARSVDRFRKEEPQDTFRGWLAVITRNKIRDHHRRRCDEPMAAGGTEAAMRLSQVPGLDDALASGDLTDGDFGEVLHRALAAIEGEFQPRTWQAFWYVVVEGRLTSDVATELQMSTGAIRVAKSRVLLRLRRELGDH